MHTMESGPFSDMLGSIMFHFKRKGIGILHRHFASVLFILPDSLIVVELREYLKLIHL